ncbi:hypothetical protein OS493_020018 [Desmophyllum pertusum]|uniref:LRAT domain-containing protein n=1 Tax=Desmophyllum pertusum TaxID=174260 RepID=A0A9W9YEN5_9CNID|nr:hypothetical protein OS493_020018 [Desmophyllum pertusum]
MVLGSSVSIWKGIEKRKSKDQEHLLQWQLQEREPIHRFSDMKAGDHLVRKGSSMGDLINYEHHFLCIGTDCDGPKIIHYYNTPGNARKQMFPTSLGSGTAFRQLGKVQEMTLPHEDFIKEGELQTKGKEVERVVWPEELRRYSVEDVIERAQRRVGEESYHLTKNNCETVVMWCLCGLNISLQATPLRKTLCEAGSAGVRTIWQGLQQVPKICTELVDDAAVAIGRTSSAVEKVALPELGLCVGVAVTLAVEAIMAGCDIRDAYKKWKGEVITLEKFIEQLVDILLLAVSRSGGSIGGMIYGQVVIPIPILGGFIGALLGVFSGHVAGKTPL